MRNSPFINLKPALYTKWFIEKDSKIFKLTIVGNIFSGIANQFEVISYVLKYDHKEKVQEIDKAKMLELIDSKILRPDWNEEGSMMATDEFIESAAVGMIIKLK
jgi:hypothetical protein